MNISYDKELSPLVFEAIQTRVKDHACPFCGVRVYLPNFAGAFTYKGKLRMIDDNILWINEPIKVTAITESGKEIDVVLTNIDNQLNMEHRTIHPDDKEQTNV